MNGTCDVCGQRRIVRKNRKTSKAICPNCYQMARYRDPSTHEKCFECGEVKPVATRSETGKAICQNCYRKDPSTHEKCFECGEVKP
ncbi:MAG: hypothetical protein Q8O19_07455, partial [Rectinemataceae bacterium]|nr:hypothetical protein [Rectinemataceae bacterium]